MGVHPRLQGRAIQRRRRRVSHNEVQGTVESPHTVRLDSPVLSKEERVQVTRPAVDEVHRRSLTPGPDRATCEAPSPYRPKRKGAVICRSSPSSQLTSSAWRALASRLPAYA